MTEIVIFLSPWIITLIGIQYWKTALIHLPNKYVWHDAVMVTFDVKSPSYCSRKEGQCCLERRVQMTMTLICKMRFCCYLCCFYFLGAVKIQLREEMEKKCVLERSKERSSFIWQRNKEWEGRSLRNSDIFAKKETDRGRVSGKFWWSWKDWIKEVPFRVGSVVFNITTSLAPSQIK